MSSTPTSRLAFTTGTAHATPHQGSALAHRLSTALKGTVALHDEPAAALALLQCISDTTLDFNALPPRLGALPLQMPAAAWTTLNLHTRIEVVALPNAARSHEIARIYPGLNCLSALREVQVRLHRGDAIPSFEGLDLREGLSSLNGRRALHIRLIRDEVARPARVMNLPVLPELPAAVSPGAVAALRVEHRAPEPPKCAMIDGAMVDGAMPASGVPEATQRDSKSCRGLAREQEDSQGSASPAKLPEDPRSQVRRKRRTPRPPPAVQ